MPILQQNGVFHAVLPAGAFTLQIEWAGAIATEPGRASAQLPQLGAGTIRATIDAPGEGSDLTIDRALVTRRARAQGRLIVDATVAPGGGSRIGWSSRDAGTASPVRALRLLDDVKTLVTVGENDLRVTAIFDVTVVQGTTATLAVRLPDGFSLTSFTGAPNEGADVVDGRLVLNVPAGRTRHQFLVALERPITDAGSRRVVALPWLEGSQRETGDIAVEGVGALELTVAEQRPLTRIDVVELSAALTALAHEPILAAYRYQRRAAEAVTLAFDVTRFPDAAVLAAAADRATATTLVTPEGRSLTEVSLTVRNQAQPFLRVGLPAGATLLSAEVAGAAVKPAQGADGLRIPLLRPGFRPQGPYAVSFVYLHAGPAFAAKGDASLTLARVDLPVAWLEWEMLLPDRMVASRFDGTAFPRELMPVASTMAAVDGLAESVTIVAGDKSRDQRQTNNELSLNVQSLQKRAAGVLPVRLDVPRTGQSHTFVRPLVMDEETRVSFRYKLRDSLPSRLPEFDSRFPGDSRTCRNYTAWRAADPGGGLDRDLRGAVGAPRLLGRRWTRGRRRRDPAAGWRGVVHAVAAGHAGRRRGAGGGRRHRCGRGGLVRRLWADPRRPRPHGRARGDLPGPRGRRLPLRWFLQIARRRSVPLLGHVAVLAAVPGDRARGADRGQEPRTLILDHSIRNAADGSMRPVRRAGIQAAMPPTSSRTTTAAAKMRGSPGSMPKSTVFRSPAPA